MKWPLIYMISRFFFVIWVKILMCMWFVISFVKNSLLLLLKSHHMNWLRTWSCHLRTVTIPFYRQLEELIKIFFHKCAKSSIAIWKLTPTTTIIMIRMIRWKICTILSIMIPVPLMFMLLMKLLTGNPLLISLFLR